MELTMAWAKKKKGAKRKKAPKTKTKTKRKLKLKVQNQHSQKYLEAQVCQADASGKNISSHTCLSETGVRTVFGAGHRTTLTGGVPRTTRTKRRRTEA